MISTILLIFFGSVILTESASFVRPSRNKPLRQQQILQQQLSPKWQPFTQVISDVDDTIKSSGGVKIGDVALGGIDTQYERGEFYPGVFEFMFHLSLHLLDDSRKPAKVAILTARAEELKAALELTPDSKIGTMLRQTGEHHGVVDWGLGPVFYGSVAEWVLQDRKGMRKFSNFELLIEQDPTGTLMQYIYVGDTGEYDQQAGEAMLREYPQVVKAVFLHVVLCSGDNDLISTLPTVPPPKLVNGRPIIFFRTYAGAALKAVQLNLMSYSGLLKVCKAAKESLQSVSRDDSKWIELERDLNAAYAFAGVHSKRL